MSKLANEALAAAMLLQISSPIKLARVEDYCIRRQEQAKTEALNKSILEVM